MTEVIPGVHQLKLPIPFSSPEYVNAYLVQGDNGYVLIDSGWNADKVFVSLEKQLAEIGANIKDIYQIIITHIHPDHYGLVGKLKQLTHAEVLMHYIEKDLIETRYINMDILLQQMEQLLHSNGVPPKELSELKAASLGMVKFVSPTLPDVILHGGETISTGHFTFQVLWTPGHSPGHICFYEPVKKILFSGDHVLHKISPNISFHPQSSEDPLGDYIKSLNTIKQLEVNLILPGHGKPFSNLAARIEELIQHHEQRNTKILEMIKTEPKTTYQIATEMAWLSGTAGTSWQKLDALNKRLALLEILAHLKSMDISGKVEKISQNSINYYQRN